MLFSTEKKPSKNFLFHYELYLWWSIESWILNSQLFFVSDSLTIDIDDCPKFYYKIIGSKTTYIELQKCFLYLFCLSFKDCIWLLCNGTEQQKKVHLQRINEKRTVRKNATVIVAVKSVKTAKIKKCNWSFK